MSMDKLSQWGLEDGRAHPKKRKTPGPCGPGVKV